MKKQFEKREKIIITGLLAMLTSQAKEEGRSARVEYKFSKKLFEKFRGEDLEVNLKPDEVRLLGKILETVIADGKRELAPDELRRMHDEDLKVCEALKSKLEYKV